MLSPDRDNLAISTTARPQSLAGLRTRLVEFTTAERSREELFHEWQARWADRKQQLIHRLDVIDQQLARLAHDARTPPRLTIVTDDDWA